MSGMSGMGGRACPTSVAQLFKAARCGAKALQPGVSARAVAHPSHEDMKTHNPRLRAFVADPMVAIRAPVVIDAAG